MSLTRWLSNHLGLSLRPASRRKTRAARPTVRPALQALEDRWVPSTLTVTSAADSGPVSLRAEIAAAKTGDTIAFAPSLNGQTITLTSGELLITQSLTIDGPGAGNLTISGNFASRVFEVGQSNGIKVTLSGLTITSGVAQDGLGGGAIENFGNLTVSNCTLSGNAAQLTGSFPEGSGGAIFNQGQPDGQRLHAVEQLGRRRGRRHLHQRPDDGRRLYHLWQLRCPGWRHRRRPRADGR